MTATLLRLEGVTKQYGQETVLHGVSLHLERGELVGFIGPNGAGKTTCLRILVGLAFRDGGEARVCALDPQTEAPEVRRRCSYLPGETSIYHSMTGAEFLAFALGFHAVLQDELQTEMTARFTLPLEQKVRKYSAGMKQKLAIMAALIPDVPIYLLDEPDRALDASNRAWLRELLRKLRAKGKTILLSSHHLGEVETLADRLVFLIDGRVIPDARVQAARRRLRHEVRLHLKQGTKLPDGVTSAVEEPDAALTVTTEEDPVAWLSRLEPGRVISAEIGVTRLDRLYGLLSEPLPSRQERP